MRELMLSNILIAACLVSISAAFRCYQCNSFTDSSCEHNPSNETLKDCVLGEDEDSLVQIQSSNCSNALNETEDCANNTISMLPPSQSVNFTICRKIVTSVYGEFVKVIGANGDTEVTTEHKKSRVTRQCGYVPAEEAYQDNDCVSRRNGGSHQLTCSCTKEECNGAERMGLTTLTLLLIPLSSMLLFFENK